MTVRHVAKKTMENQVVDYLKGVSWLPHIPNGHGDPAKVFFHTSMI